MTTSSQPRATYPGERPQWMEALRIPQLWAGITISVMWIAVALASVYGGDFVSTNGSGTNSTTIPSGIVVALFATLATGSLAKRAFRDD